MNFKFEILFATEFRHQYFGDALCNGFTLTPSDRTRDIMKRNGLVCKTKNGGFFVGYDTGLGSGVRKREDVLLPELLLSFRLDLTDLSLYNYTDHLPENIFASIFHFRNFTIPPIKDIVKPQEKESLPVEIANPSGMTPRASLTEDPMASEKDIDARSVFKEQYFSKPFGQVSILLHGGLEKNLMIKFAAKATYWQYILSSEYLLQLKKPAIINRSTQSAFMGPEPVTLPGNRPGIAFVSEEPILLSSAANREFFLVENYEPGNERPKIIIDYLSSLMI